MTSPYDDPKFREWAERRRRELLPKIDASTAFLGVLLPPFTVERLDIQQALEIGTGLLLGKPLILCVTPGTQLPCGLAAAAAEIVEIDNPISPANRQRLQEAIARVTQPDASGE